MDNNFRMLYKEVRIGSKMAATEVRRFLLNRYYRVNCLRPPHSQANAYKILKSQ